MNFDSRFKLSSPGSNLYNFQTNRIKLGTGPLAPFKMKTPECMQKNISGRVEKEPKLVGFKTAAGGPVREKMVLMFFDEKFGLSPSTVDRLIDKSAVPVLKIRHNKPHILPEGVGLHSDNNPFWLRPALRLIEKLTKDLDRLLLPGISLLRFHNKLFRLFFQGHIGLEPENIFYLLLFAKLINSRTTVIGVTPEKDPHLRPGLSDSLDHPLEDGDDLLACRTLSRPKNRCYQLPASPFIDMHRHVAVVIMKGIEESQLLISVGWIIGIIYIQDDCFWRFLIRFDKNIQKHLGYPVKVRAGKAVLKTAHGWLTGQRLLLRQPLTGYLQHWVIPQLVGIIAVLIAIGDLKDSLLEKLGKLMFYISGMSAIPQNLSYPADKPYLSLYFTQENKPSIRTDFTPLEVCFHFFSTNIFKKKQLFGMIIFVQGCFLLIFTLTYYKTIRYERKQLFL